MFKKIILSLLLLIVILVGSLFTYVQVNKSPQIFELSLADVSNDERPIADPISERQIDTGKIVGLADSYNTYAWLGIPYAAAPTGALRWRAPQAAPSWTETLTATEFASPCLQYWTGLAGVEGERGDIAGSEDCLYLNVWAPREAKNKLPVMLWIHGGDNQWGSSNTYPSHHLAGSKDVVVVTINYRMSLLGWFSHESLRQTSDNFEDASGNYGTLDTIAALEWVQRNITSFGGDPNNVTIFGESAGGRNVFALLASPLAKGLFHKAISQSGTTQTLALTLAEDYPDESPRRPISGLKNSSSALIELVAKQRFTDLSQDELRTEISEMSAAELMAMLRNTEAQELMRLVAENADMEGYIPIADVLQDGYVLPKTSTLQLLDDPAQYNDVPLILGTTRDEHKLFLFRDPEFVNSKLGFIPEIKDPVRYQVVSDYFSETWKAGAVDDPAKRIFAAGGSPVYAYRFDWDDASSNFLVDVKALLGAAHGMEVSFVFGSFSTNPLAGFVNNKDNAEARKLLSQSMMDYWTAFAHHGDPGQGLSGQQPQWRSWQDSGENVMLLDAHTDIGVRMDEIRTNIAELKQRLSADKLLPKLEDKCRAFAMLFLHGYQTNDYWNENEYAGLGCQDYPAGEFRIK